jgi:inorganic triphosphatase YgiF
MLARVPAKAAPELEIKFQLGAGAVEALERELFPADQAAVSRMHAVYFDTPSHILRDASFSLRVRRKGDRYVQTLKHRAAGGLFERDEWETPVAGPDLDLDALTATPAHAALSGALLTPTFVVEVERRVHIWTQDDTRIEVSFDTGLITADARSEPIAELELELLAGSPAVLFQLARHLQAEADLTLLLESKAERGYRLAGHDGVAALKAQKTAVGPSTPGGQAFQLIGRDALVQIAGNARLLQRAHNPDVLHQARVGLRRMRAALAVFKAMLDPEGLNLARAETKWLAGELSQARDFDVFLQRVAVRDEIEDNPGRAAFFRALRHAQAEAYERALAAVRSARFRALLLTLAEWIEIGAWSRQAGERHRALREGPAAALAAPVMERLDHRFRRRSRGFRHLDVDTRHDVRKQGKKLRYATAFFGEAFPEHPKRRARQIAALKAVQDRLGELNDLAVARVVVAKVVGKRTGDLARAARRELERLVRDEDDLLRSARDALKAYRRTRAFWPEPDGDEDLNLSPPSLRRA